MRFAVVGNSGAGKTTFAVALAHRLGASHIELDSIHHLPDWQPLSDDEFRQRVATELTKEDWVADGNYSIVSDLVWGQAEAVVILAYPRPLVMRRVVARSVRRVLMRQELWNRNRERWANLLSWDPQKSIIRWSWTTYHKNLDRYRNAMADPQWSSVCFLRFTHPRQAEAFLRGL